MYSYFHVYCLQVTATLVCMARFGRRQGCRASIILLHLLLPRLTTYYLTLAALLLLLLSLAMLMGRTTALLRAQRVTVSDNRRGICKDPGQLSLRFIKNAGSPVNRRLGARIVVWQRIQSYRCST